MESVSALVDLGVPGLAAGDLTITCQKWTDFSVVSSAGCTLTPLGTGGRYWLTNPNITTLTGFEAKITTWPEKYCVGQFSALDRTLPSRSYSVLVDFDMAGLAIGDLTLTCQKRSDLSVISTAAWTLTAIGTTGRYWLTNPAVTSLAGFEAVVTAWPDRYAFGVFNPLDVNVITSTGTTRRQQILSYLDALLATITVANGYRTNLGQDVHEWQPHALDPNESTLRVEYRDEAGTTGYIAVGEHLHTLPVTLRVTTKNNTSGSALEAVRAAIADIYAAIYTDVTFGGLAEDTNQEGQVKESYGEAADRAASAEVTYVIEYTTVPGTP